MLMFCFICTTSILTVLLIPEEKEVVTSRGIAELLFKDDLDQLRLTQGYHGLSGFQGYDYTTECGDKLYSPLPGRGIVRYLGRDGYIGKYDTKKEQNTMIVIEGHAGKVTLLHGEYSEVEPGDIVIGGKTHIGYNRDIGNATGCHAHIVWKPNRNYVNHNSEIQLVISSYRPEEGGSNCQEPCNIMASGDTVAEWRLGKNGVQAAACPGEWPFGTQFELSGQIYECRDRGGWINCLQLGDYDPAYSNLYGQPFYADTEYCWVDILGDSGYNYGSRTTNWRFINGIR